MKYKYGYETSDTMSRLIEIVKQAKQHDTIEVRGEAARQMAERALKRMGKDGITVVVCNEKTN